MPREAVESARILPLPVSANSRAAMRRNAQHLELMGVRAPATALERAGELRRQHCSAPGRAGVDIWLIAVGLVMTA
jgi:hypothetical protein